MAVQFVIVNAMAVMGPQAVIALNVVMATSAMTLVQSVFLYAHNPTHIYLQSAMNMYVLHVMLTVLNVLDQMQIHVLLVPSIMPQLSLVVMSV